MAVGAAVGTGVGVGTASVAGSPPQATTRARVKRMARERIASLAARRVVKEFIHIL